MKPIVNDESIVLAAVSKLLELARSRGKPWKGVSFYALNKLLFEVKKAVQEKLGIEVLKSINFIEYSYGPYSPDLEQLLIDMARKGVISYEVEIHIPRAPIDVDPELGWAVIEHQLSEYDADRKYVRKVVIPLKMAEGLDPEIEKLLNDVVQHIYEELYGRQQGSA